MLFGFAWAFYRRKRVAILCIPFFGLHPKSASFRDFDNVVSALRTENAWVFVLQVVVNNTRSLVVRKQRKLWRLVGIQILLHQAYATINVCFYVSDVAKFVLLRCAGAYLKHPKSITFFVWAMR